MARFRDYGRGLSASDFVPDQQSNILSHTSPKDTADAGDPFRSFGVGCAYAISSS